MSNTFNRKNMLGSLAKAGVGTASVLEPAKPLESRPGPRVRVALDDYLLSQIAQRIGPLATYAYSLTRHMLQDLEYSTFEQHTGNANIGFVYSGTGSSAIYRVGRIESIFEVHQGRERPPRTVYV
ncbi:13241_t:CDS:1, partial [Acaulospora colombiana]